MAKKSPNRYWRPGKKHKAEAPVIIPEGATARIVRNELDAKLHTRWEPVREAVNRLLRYRVEGYYFMPLYKAGKWDGYIRLLKRDGTFPGGLADRAVAHLRGQGVVVEYEDRTLPLEGEPQLAGGTSDLDLRPYQVEAVNRAIEHGRGVFESATGTGKTVILGEVIRRDAARSLIMVASRDLAHQTIERFQDSLAFPHSREPLYGIVGDNIDQRGLITAALYQTLARRLTPTCSSCGEAGERDKRYCRRTYADSQARPRKCHGLLDYSDVESVEAWLATIEAIHLDETHRVAAETWWPVVNACPAPRRYGYSATAFKSDKATELKVVGATGEIIFSFSATAAIEEGYLTRPYVVFIDAEFPPFSEDFSFKWAYDEGIVRHEGRNRLIVEIAATVAGKWKAPTLILLQRIEQGRWLERNLRQAGLEAEFVPGSGTGTDERKTLLRALARGKIDVLIGTTWLDEGVDVPEIGALILAGGMRAHHKQIQRIGRGLRLSEGKDYLPTFDFNDSHSLKLLDHSEERREAVRKAGYSCNILPVSELRARLAAGDLRTPQARETWGHRS